MIGLMGIWKGNINCAVLNGLWRLPKADTQVFLLEAQLTQLDLAKFCANLKRDCSNEWIICPKYSAKILTKKKNSLTKEMKSSHKTYQSEANKRFQLESCFRVLAKPSIVLTIEDVPMHTAAKPATALPTDLCTKWRIGQRLGRVRS